METSSSSELRRQLKIASRNELLLSLNGNSWNWETFIMWDKLKFPVFSDWFSKRKTIPSNNPNRFTWQLYFWFCLFKLLDVYAIISSYTWKLQTPETKYIRETVRAQNPLKGFTCPVSLFGRFVVETSTLSNKSKVKAHFLNTYDTSCRSRCDFIVALNCF